MGICRRYGRAGGGGARPRVTERIEREDASEGDLLRGRYGYPDITIHLTLFSASIAEGVPELLEHNDLKWITPSEIDRFE